jgi:hypothetical protein
MNDHKSTWAMSSLNMTSKFLSLPPELRHQILHYMMSLEELQAKLLLDWKSVRDHGFSASATAMIDTQIRVQAAIHPKVEEDMSEVRKMWLRQLPLIQRPVERRARLQALWAKLDEYERVWDEYEQATSLRYDDLIGRIDATHERSQQRVEGLRKELRGFAIEKRPA